VERKCKNRFRVCLRQKWIDLRRTKIKMITGPFYTYREIHFISEDASFSLEYYFRHFT